ncbi:iron-containing alcohol dehydrogenase [Paenibacillus cisolokensis]|uniref:iron-containing alcohol dehydrogenase n=1 Tax=Paenibacillus cisolokensis TaxID=1658519 RepID=UPI003D27DB64
MNEAVRTYTFQTAGRIVAGRHALSGIGAHLREMGPVRRALVVASGSAMRSGFVAEIEAQLAGEGVACDTLSGIVPEPTADHIEELAARLAGEEHDVYIGIGGGSVLDATKLLAVRKTNDLPVGSMPGTDAIARDGVPTVLVPTTSGTGSEVTPNAIVTLPERELKVGVVSRRLLPRLALLDPIVTVSQPRHVTAATGMDAFTHALESFISNKANPFSDMAALESIRKIAGGIVRAFRDGRDLEAREDMLVGSMYGGMALTAAGTAAVHAMAYPLGGKFGIPHGVANAMLLPHVMAFNLDRIADRLAAVAGAMGIGRSDGRTVAAAEKVVRQIEEWTALLEIPQDLGPFGVREEHIADLAVAAASVRRLMDNNPKPMTVDDIAGIYRRLLPG